MCTLEKVRLSVHYADWKPAIPASRRERIVWIFSPGHAGVLGNERADVLPGSSEMWDNLIMGHPAVGAVVQELMTATRTEVSYRIPLTS